jgi:branched-chain amino acid transport system ATP-binding protein
MQQAIQADYVIETRSLSKRFGGFLAVENLDLRIRRGTLHAIIGPNGAGKTTLFNLLTKFLAPSSGQIFYDGKDVTGVDPSPLARQGIVRSFQISAVFPHMSVLENIRIALQRKLNCSFRFWQPESSLHVLHDEAERLLDLVDLKDLRFELAGALSYGRKRALELATTIALRPNVLLLDEPTSGMGSEDINKVMQLIERVSSDRTVLMVEHNLHVVSELSDCITVMNRGQILAEGSYEEVSRNSAVMEAYLGTGG